MIPDWMDDIPIWVLLAVPWLAIPVAGWLSFRGRCIFALVLCALSGCGTWVLLYALSFARTGGKLIGGPSLFLGVALNWALVATGLSLLAISGAAYLRRKTRGPHGR